MASKQLTATVRLNTKQAESALKSLEKKINGINRAVTRTKATDLEKQLRKCGTQANRLNQAVSRVNTTLSRTATTGGRVRTAIQTATTQTRQWANAQRSVNSSIRSSGSLLGSIGTKLKGIAATYLGVMGAKAVIGTSDMITSAQNKLNNIKGGNPEQTDLTMDKVYAAAQRSRSGYGDMLSNVSKTMTLAPDAFQGNIDNAIRFQEIMSKAYTVGGASAQEQSASMYQLVQALGSGILQGDELRSVREGAPVAYKKIEEFTQGVLKSEESLKELASQGRVTSDMVVAAIMDAEKSINKSFENTSMTFAQAWTMIKNSATKAFEPVLENLNKMLNSDGGKAALEGIEKALVGIANTLSWVISKLTIFFTWCADNWEWLKYVILGALILIGIHYTILAAKAIWAGLKMAWGILQSHWALLLIVACLMYLLYMYELWKQGTITTCDFIAEAVLALGLIIILVLIAIGVIATAGVALIALAVVGLIYLILKYFAELCGYVNIGVQAIVNAWFWCGNLIFGIWEWLKAVFHNAIEFIKGTFFGCVEWVKTLFSNLGNWFSTFGQAIANVFNTVCDNIGIAFSNAWTWAKNTFWEFIADVIDGVGKLEPVINGIAKLLGKDGVDFDSLSSNIRSKKTEYTEFKSIGDAWNSAWDTYQWQDLTDSYKNAYQEDYVDVGEAWNKGWNTYDVFQDGWSTDAYNQGYDWGKGIEDKVNQWGSKFQTGEKGGIFSDLGNMLGLNGGGLPNPNDSALGLGGAYDPDAIKDSLGNIDDNTKKMSDSMDLENDDLEYLRKLAEMEWRNEFTTAEIKVDMTNNNTVNGERDLDGIVEYLSDVLRSEMASVADGVHY